MIFPFHRRRFFRLVLCPDYMQWAIFLQREKKSVQAGMENKQSCFPQRSANSKAAYFAFLSIHSALNLE